MTAYRYLLSTIITIGKRFNWDTKDNFNTTILTEPERKLFHTNYLWSLHEMDNSSKDFIILFWPLLKWTNCTYKLFSSNSGTQTAKPFLTWVLTAVSRPVLKWSMVLPILKIQRQELICVTVYPSGYNLLMDRPRRNAF